MATVLIVDDEAPIRTLVTRWLQACGHEVDGAASAEEAIERLAHADVDVLVCDRNMPGRDGLWLARQVEARFPAIAIILTSGAPEEDAREPVFAGYLGKPFGRERLREVVARAIDHGVAA